VITQSEEKTLPFREHLVELRQRLVKSVIAVGIVFIIAFNYSEQILKFLTIPLKPYIGAGNLVYLRVQDGFFIFFKVALVMALIIASPVIVYQIFMFMAPGLYDKEKKLLKIIITIGSLSFFAGFAFLYQILLPVFFNFFSRFIFDFYEVFPNVTEYIDFVLKFNLYAGVLFMIPFAIFIMVFFKLITVEKLLELRRVFILLSFIIAALLTPPDILSQILLSAIIIALFELGILIVRTKNFFSH
jgi:sec-independent protein translocase protein TatC